MAVVVVVARGEGGPQIVGSEDGMAMWTRHSLNNRLGALLYELPPAVGVVVTSHSELRL